MHVCIYAVLKKFSYTVVQGGQFHICIHFLANYTFAPKNLVSVKFRRAKTDKSNWNPPVFNMTVRDQKLAEQPTYFLSDYKPINSTHISPTFHTSCYRAGAVRQLKQIRTAICQHNA